MTDCMVFFYLVQSFVLLKKHWQTIEHTYYVLNHRQLLNAHILGHATFVCVRTNIYLFTTICNILFQFMFMQHPRCVFLITSLAMLTLLLGLFTLYHFYLVISNQTTNERYKMASLPINNNSSITQANGHNNKSAQKDSPLRAFNGQGQHHKENSKNKHSYLRVKNNRRRSPFKEEASNHVIAADSKAQAHSDICRTHSEDQLYLNSGVISDIGTFYNRGFFQNIKEVLLPWSGVGSIKQLNGQR